MSKSKVIVNITVNKDIKADKLFVDDRYESTRIPELSIYGSITPKLNITRESK